LKTESNSLKNLDSSYLFSVNSPQNESESKDLLFSFWEHHPIFVPTATHNDYATGENVPQIAKRNGPFPTFLPSNIENVKKCDIINN
jgi:hypothetical protein